jgi:hypothetical protein
VCNLAGLLTLNDVTLENWFCWWGADGIGLELYRVASFVGRAVAQLVDALRYKPEGRGFDSQWCNWNF